MPIIVDSHCHIQFPEFDKDRDAVIGRARGAGVKMLAIGADFATSQEAVKIAHQYPDDIWATAGFHPNNLNKETMEGKPEVFDAGRLLELAKDERVAAIGECGLEYYRLGSFDEKTTKRIKEVQKQGFVEQIKIAEKLKKPLMIHCRPAKGTDDANKDFFGLLKTENYKLKFVVLHFYAGSLEMAKKFAEIGCYFTFGGVITFTRDKDEIVKYLPLDRILLETDAPYVAPEPYRGKRNEPAYVVEVAKKMAEIKGVSFEEAANQTYKNAKEVFGI